MTVEELIEELLDLDEGLSVKLAFIGPDNTMEYEEVTEVETVFQDGKSIVLIR